MSRKNNPLRTVKSETINGYHIGIRNTRYDPNKKTIILIHGIGVSSAYYLPFAQKLTATYNIFALDLPGYGKTQKPKKPLNIDELADITASYIVKNNLTKITLIGHSMGCQIIARLAKTKPKNIHKMILLSPTVNRHERSIFIQGLRLMQDTLHETPKTNAVIFSDYLRMGFIRYLKTSRWMVKDRIEDIIKLSTTKTLIVRGEKDYISPRGWVAYLQSLSSSFTAYELPQAPHALQHSHPQELANVCRTYIET